MKTTISITQDGRTIRVSEITDRAPATDFCLGQRNFTSAKSALKHINGRLSSRTIVHPNCAALYRQLQERAAL